MPAGCTGELQPLDVEVNLQLKGFLRDCFTKWYADCVTEALKAEPHDLQQAVKSVKPDLRLSVMKPKHAGWIMDAISCLQQKPEVDKSAWRHTGITEALQVYPSHNKTASIPLVVPTSPQSHQIISATTNSSGILDVWLERDVKTWC